MAFTPVRKTETNPTRPPASYMRLYKDYETASELDLTEVGLDNYARHPSTRILMMAYAVDDGPVQLWQPHLSEYPREIYELDVDPLVEKVAWNSQFERYIALHKQGINIPIEQWIDPMINARYLSIPGYLEDAGRIMGLSGDDAKLVFKTEEDKTLVETFCIPYKPGGEDCIFGKTEAWFRDWVTDPELWDVFCKYCMQDVAAERLLLKKMEKFPLPENERRGWIMDQEINDRGMPVDMTLVSGAIKIAEAEKRLLGKQLLDITGLDNPNSRDQLLGWLKPRGYSFGSLQKPLVARALAGELPLTPEAKQVLEIRKQSAKTSDSKFYAIVNNVSGDMMLRNQFAFLGSSRAGRWSGRDVQLHNMPRPSKMVGKNLEEILEIVKKAYHDQLAAKFAPVMETLSGCIRSCFKAPPGWKLVVCDLNAIENRVLGWVARCESILEVFALGRDPYIAFATFMTGKTYEELYDDWKSGRDSATRQNAKPAVLGAGYRLGGGRQEENADGDIVYTGLWGYAKGMGIEMTQEQAQNAVDIFREAYPEVVQLWYDLENASIKCVKTGRDQTVGPVTFSMAGTKLLRILLPSGRYLHYIHPAVEERDFFGKMKEMLVYDGIGQKTREWERVPTHGGKLTENVVQAIARDILLEGMFRANDLGFTLAGHCHDEIISMVPKFYLLGIDDLRECMKEPMPWAPDLPLDAAGYESEVYKKE